MWGHARMWNMAGGVRGLRNSGPFRTRAHSNDPETLSRATTDELRRLQRQVATSRGLIKVFPPAKRTARCIGGAGVRLRSPPRAHVKAALLQQCFQ